MRWSVLTPLGGCVVDRVVGTRRTEEAKALAIALLRHQVRLLQRRSPRPPRRSRWEQVTGAVLAARLHRLTARPQARLARALLLVQPATVLQWQRELVRRQWTCRRRHRGGRPPIAAAVAALLLRQAVKHPGWGYGRIQGS